MLSASPMPLLQGAHIHFIALQRGNAVSGGPGGRNGGDSRDAVRHGGAPDGLFIEPRLQALRGVDHKLHAVAFNKVHHKRLSFFQLVDALYMYHSTFSYISECCAESN